MAISAAAWLLLLAAAAVSAQPAGPRVEVAELITNEAATGDGGNAWGGHQTRIVRTADGVFTAYTVAGGGPVQRQWRLAHRTKDGWREIGQGPSGREPVNLMAGPDGTLYVAAWPEGLPRLWTSRKADGRFAFDESAVPGQWDKSNWPYASGGIGPGGDICLLQSGGDKPGRFNFAFRRAGSARWEFHQVPLDYRYCYTYVFPGANGQLALVSTRDVRWVTLGYEQPKGAFGFVFNAVRCWQTPNVALSPLAELAVAEARPTPEFRNVSCNAQLDACADTRGRMHILYTYRGAETNGRDVCRHALLEDGRVTKTVDLPAEGGAFWRIIQDTQRTFYLIGSAGLVYTAVDEEGMDVRQGVKLDLGGRPVEYSGIAVSAPRCGVPPADFVDCVFPSGAGREWVYFRLRLR